MILALNLKNMKETNMNQEFNELIEKARQIKMSKEDKERQRISFAYGNLKIKNPNTTREDIEKAAQKIRKQEENKN
ncbi:MAG: hypothetical protein COV29_02820 [Candidatus Yanofskybacteria bacterium CG10_big_fil_rev_8_21_14_0_10_36_16]|uniref:Uncharacterized protein n=1 Tax=Candidatus Yanofskybacteria bacterium CG10_big_fil_rev_8_21_14_0_10_36_16 TaxID=1975096 RepID=A0A2J0Q7X3_9BACT|nr:MAG: hypothetical protein COV29_02820 [Candidatus Yanofskybacteria bacterium CG10_big_fil_rev_8_21_14_0_10_36_16]